MSASSFHRGFFARLACRSHIALTMAAIEMWMTPFSGPSHRSCESPASARQNAAGSAARSAPPRLPASRERPPERGGLGEDLVDGAADHQRRERADRLGAHLVAPADGE